MDTFVIGIGGTGIKTLIHVKKKLLEQHGKIPHNVQLKEGWTSPD